MLQLCKTLVLVGVSPEAEVGDAGCVLSRLEEFKAPGSPPSMEGWSPAASGNGDTGRGGALQETQRTRQGIIANHALFYPTRGSKCKRKALADCKHKKCCIKSL